MTNKNKSAACVSKQSVVIYKVKRGKDPAVGKPLVTSSKGAFALRKKLSKGKYYVTVKARTIADVAECGVAKSKTVVRR